MRIENVVKALKERQMAMQEAVFSKTEFDAVQFAKAQGRWQGLGEAISVIADEMRKSYED